MTFIFDVRISQIQSHRRNGNSNVHVGCIIPIGLVRWRDNDSYSMSRRGLTALLILWEGNARAGTWGKQESTATHVFSFIANAESGDAIGTKESFIMKKFLTLLAVALMGLSAFADDVPCPSAFSFRLAAQNADGAYEAAEQVSANNVVVEVMLTNSSENLNGFNMQIQKQTIDGEYCPEMDWVKNAEDNSWAGFSGYGHTILARWDVADPSLRETELFNMCDCMSSQYMNELIIIEFLKTIDCRFFPVLEEPAPIARFTVDMSNCPDGDYRFYVPADARHCSFSYTGGVEGTPPDAPVVLELTKAGDVVETRPVSTAISEIAAEQTVDNRIFDLMGHQLKSIPEHGIYIQNGKKYTR